MKAKNNSHQTAKIHIKKGDTVVQIAGKIVDNNNTGKVLRVYTKTYRAVVEGWNIISRHTKPSASNPNGGIIKREAPIHISNLMLLDGKTATRVGRKENEKGKLQRYSVKTGEFIS